MKKFLAILLAILMLASFASLAACGTKEQEETKEPETQEETKEPEVVEEVETEEEKMERLENSKPNEFVREKLDAGMDVTVAFCGLANGYFTMTQMCGGIQEAVEAEGFKFQSSCADSNTATMMDQCENFITMGCAGIVLMAGDGDAFVDLNTYALEQGTYLVFYGIDINFDAINTNTDTKLVGKTSAKMLLEWADQNYPDAGDGELHAAVIGHTGMLETKNMYDAAIETLSADPRITISYTNDAAFSVEDGYTYAEAAFTADPQTRLFWGFQMGTALGINNFLLTVADVPLSEFAVVGNSVDDTTMELIAGTGKGEGAIIGTVQAGESVTATTVKALLDVLYGEITVPTTVFDPLFPITSEGWTFSGIQE